ncbi:protein of unknown function [Hyphomicrobium sp. 1Nfss2.1]|uniref:hypothetical protein n=1 Tax=Hyphomicrobium sp. 1Nfss2.1 TaxID=3413936 RepID=UPI003C7C32EA
MPLFHIETTTQVRRVYEIEAASLDAAEEAFDNVDGKPTIVMEEDISEEVDAIRPIAVSAWEQGDPARCAGHPNDGGQGEGETP